jgi:hypothetical protein
MNKRNHRASKHKHQLYPRIAKRIGNPWVSIDYMKGYERRAVSGLMRSGEIGTISDVRFIAAPYIG